MPGQPGAAPYAAGQAGAASAPTFIAELARLTGLDPKVLTAWVNSEGAYAPNGTGGYNYLNIRTSKSYGGVPLAGTTSNGFAQFYNAHDAARETAHWINSMPNYAGIRQAAKLGPKTQIAAIAASPWDSGHYGGGRKLYDSYASVAGGGGGLGFGWSDVASAIGKVGSAVAGGIVPGGGSLIPGVGSVSGVLDAPSRIAGSVETVAADIGWLTKPENWLRIGYIMGGGVLVFGGLFILARSVGSSNAAAAVKDSATQVASMAPEVRAAAQGTRVSRGEAAHARRQPSSRARKPRTTSTPAGGTTPRRTKAKSASAPSSFGPVPF